jgi:hypothetical protein
VEAFVPFEPLELLKPIIIGQGTKAATVEPEAVEAEVEVAGRSWSNVFLGLMIVFVLIGVAAVGFLLTQNYLPFDFGRSNQVVVVPATAEEEQAVLDAVYENIAASNLENIERYMASIHSQSEEYQQTRQLLEELYRDYDLTATLRNVELTSYTADEAQVSFVLETRKRSGPDFRNNVINGVFILRPENGQWKLYDQIVRQIDYLN